MLRDMIIGERPHDSLAGPASLHLLDEINSFIHKHFWRTVNFPAVAPGTPAWSSAPVHRPLCHQSLIAVFAAVIVARPPDPLTAHLTGVAFGYDKAIRPWRSVSWVMRIRPVRRGALRRERGRRGERRGLGKRGKAVCTPSWGPGPCCGPHAYHQEEKQGRDHPDGHHTTPRCTARPAVKQRPACETDSVLHLNTFFLGARPPPRSHNLRGCFGTGGTGRARRRPCITQSSTFSPGGIPKRSRRAFGIVNCPLLLMVMILIGIGSIIAKPEGCGGF
jgi:hypothetical protein